MRERLPQKTLGDYVTIALSPLLIMALVGSLVFFLLEVLYAGQYSSRLQWTMFWFVFAMVLIARIAIEQNDGKAGMYGLALGAAVFVSLQMFVEYPPDAPLTSFRWLVNLVLMALIWWCAHRLVWDCTYIEDADKSSGSGILDAAGLDAEQGSTEEAEDDDADEIDEKKSAAKRSKKQHTGVTGWFDRHRLYRERQSKKPHTPGVWIVYFSLAALPLFGLGQSLIPAAALDRRRYAFWLMVIYVGSGLGLLLTTSYLGLRRYLRQRKLKMPVSTTAVWLTLGGGLIVAMLLVGALLPRPYGEYQLIKIRPLGSPKREASKHAILRDGAGKGQGSASKDPKATDAKAKDGSGNQRSDKGGGSAKGDKGSGSGKGNKSGGSSKGDKSGGKSGKGKSSDDQSRDDSRKSADEKAEKSDRSDDQDKDKNDDKKQQEKSGSGRSQDQQDKQNKDDSENKDESGGSDQQESSPSSFQFMDKLGWLGTLLKWIVFAVIALVAIFFVIRSGLRWLANFTLWARNLLNALSAWWQSLFGGGSGTRAGGTEEDETEPVRRPRPFTSFSNPFRDGTATQVSPEEVARYTFAALEAWAYDHDLAREQEETPLEFFERVAKLTPSLAADGKRMVGCYVRVAYARSRLAPAALEALEKFWISLESADGPDMAAKAAWEDENGA